MRVGCGAHDEKRRRPREGKKKKKTRLLFLSPPAHRVLLRLVSSSGSSSCCSAALGAYVLFFFSSSPIPARVSPNPPPRRNARKVRTRRPRAQAKLVWRRRCGRCSYARAPRNRQRPTRRVHTHNGRLLPKRARGAHTHTNWFIP